MADVVIVSWVVLCLYGVKYCKGKNNYWNDYLSKENTLMLKGVFSIVVILHHLSQRFKPLPVLFKFFGSAGPWAVMFFFFISGYGVLFNWIHKENYDRGFLTKRFKAIIPLYLIAIIIYWVVYAFYGELYSLLDVAESMINGSPIVSHSWYILVILVFYVLFYLQMKLLKRNYALIIISSVVLCALWVIMCDSLGFGSWWRNYVFSIPLGMTWALYKEKIDDITHRFYWPLLFVFFSLFLISWRCQFNNRILYYIFNFCGNLFRQSIFFPITVMIITMKFKIGNKALKTLGTISLETYIFHGLFSSLIFERTSLPIINGTLYSVFSIAFAVIFSLTIYIFYTKTVKKCDLKSTIQQPTQNITGK